MADIPIEGAHKSQLAGMQHVLQWLKSEKQRLEAELQHVAQQGQRVQGEVASILQHVYGVDTAAPWVLDTEQGVITVPDVATAAPVDETPDAASDADE